jgi:hypothetical protein
MTVSQLDTIDRLNEFIEAWIEEHGPTMRSRHLERACNELTAQWRNRVVNRMAQVCEGYAAQVRDDVAAAWAEVEQSPERQTEVEAWLDQRFGFLKNGLAAMGHRLGYDR